jgi:iron complex transport system substrate-binding protein
LKGALAAVLLAAAALGCKAAPKEAARDAAPSGPAIGAPTRIVSVGGTVTEIVFALGRGADVVAVDTSSVFPASVAALPHVGYERTLAAEGIASARPSRILLSSDAGPEAAITQLYALGVPIDTIHAVATADGARAAIGQVAKALGEQARGEAVVRGLDADLERARDATARVTERPKVLFVYARGPGMLMVSGTKTPADAMIRLAAADNAAGAFEGFKPLTAEAVAAAMPDVVLIPERGLASLGGVDGLLAQPGLSLTPAGKARRVVAMDDLLLLGFGPRLGEAVLELSRALHPSIAELSP